VIARGNPGVARHRQHPRRRQVAAEPAARPPGGQPPGPPGIF